MRALPKRGCVYGCYIFGRHIPSPCSHNAHGMPPEPLSIGEKAIPGQVVDANSTANFGVGAFLLAACEMVRFLNAD